MDRRSGLVLKPLDGQDGRDIYEMLQRIGPDENAFTNEANGMTYEAYRGWLQRQLGWSRGVGLPEGYVKQWTFWLYDGADVVGYGKLRERITEKSRNFGGNIGFAIDPLARGKGYGSYLFSALLNKAKAMGLSEVVSTVEKGNEISKQIHEKCGGVLIGENEYRYIFNFPEICNSVKGRE